MDFPQNLFLQRTSETNHVPVRAGSPPSPSGPRGPERSNSQQRTFSSTSHQRTTTTPRGKTAHAPPAKREESPAYQNPTQEGPAQRIPAQWSPA
ncbi:hypothetical protein AAFF_G00307690 [Aldrovandia affinis]|uniref:Uncharacterized protein n=1 Tax=Aldrovandia affinis TaxID=143900 RepID=A0AAD7R8N8_9TELE|nr:hypothetical protein AAFF_G00307690 [Aldrovandia affinis]